jgi:hypothetical protein
MEKDLQGIDTFNILLDKSSSENNKIKKENKDLFYNALKLNGIDLKTVDKWKDTFNKIEDKDENTLFWLNKTLFTMNQNNAFTMLQMLSFLEEDFFDQNILLSLLSDANYLILLKENSKLVK